jgi:molybdopterin molybdotransferase
MLSFEEARSRLMAMANPVGDERVSLDEACGRVLAIDIVAGRSLPPFDTSAMDGYALACERFVGDAPYRLPVSGLSRAGHAPSETVAPAACRIFTGAAVPSGCDTVVMQEDVRIEEGVAVFDRRPSRGSHVRRAGGDVAAGSIALERGTRLGAAHLSLAAALGQSRLVVARRPRVTVVCVGDELREPGDDTEGSVLFESNGVALAALGRTAGAHVSLSPILRDDLDAAAQLFSDELGRCDLLVTVGGASVGDYDLVRPALEAAGVTLDFWKVALKPGKPVAVGRRGGTIVLALPGNPASAFVTFVLFAMPLIRAIQGDQKPLPTTLRLPLARSVQRQSRRTEFLRARLVEHEGAAVVALHDNQSSGALSSLAWCDALARLPDGLERVEAGTIVELLRLSDA